MSELPIITQTDDWLDLRTGEEAIVRGRVFAATHKGIVLTTPDWTDIYIECEYGDNLQHLMRQVVDLPVTRTEDGLHSSQAQTHAVKVTDYA